jgi:hypothetical protein
MAKSRTVTYTAIKRCCTLRCPHRLLLKRGASMKRFENSGKFAYSDRCDLFAALSNWPDLTENREKLVMLIPRKAEFERRALWTAFHPKLAAGDRRDAGGYSQTYHFV